MENVTMSIEELLKQRSLTDETPQSSLWRFIFVHMLPHRFGGLGGKHHFCSSVEMQAPASHPRKQYSFELQ